MRLLEFSAAGCTLAAIALLAWRCRWGWPVNVLGNCLWMVWGVETGAFCLVGLNALLAAWGVYGLHNWGREGGGR
jgi:hypothetical protein